LTERAACQDKGKDGEPLIRLLGDFRAASLRRPELVLANPEPRKWRDQNAQNEAMDFALRTTRFAARRLNLAIWRLRIFSVAARTVLFVCVAFSLATFSGTTVSEAVFMEKSPNGTEGGALRGNRTAALNGGDCWTE
jgi:hypothetical protein